MSDEKLMELALQARESSYSPYSHFRVGAALLCADDSVYTGCNIENAAFTPGICAERTAIYKAVSEGKRAFTAIAIAGGSEDSAPALTAPCGVCRQVMREFCEDDFRIYMVGKDGVYLERTLNEILPDSFRPKDHMQE